MSNLTRDAIKASFLKLLEERPYNKITVRDIVDGCGVNRNTFYYHFHDVPSLLEEIIRDDADRIIREYPSIESIEACVGIALQFAQEHRRAVLHIFNSVNRGIYEHYLWNACEYTVRTYLNTVFPDRKISGEDREIIVRYYKCVCFGAVAEWLEDGMRSDVRDGVHRLCELKKGQAEELIRRCEEQSQ